MSDRTEITAPDGRTLEVLTAGDPDGLPWLYIPGSPSAAVPFPWLDDLVERLGLRMVSYSRPGYGGSSPRPHPDRGPRMVDDVADVVTVLDTLGVAEFVTLGWSGGAPRALACAALLPDRCLAAASLAGVGPRGVDGLDWADGMAPENQAEYAAAVEGPDAYAAYLEQEFLPVMRLDVAQLEEGLGELLTPVDRAAFSGELATYLAASMKAAAAQGVVGARDDGLAAVAPWGFDLGEISVPVAVWQGSQDAMVPFAHGVWLAAHVPGAHVHLLEGEGHISLVNRLEEILRDLVALGRARAR